MPKVTNDIEIRKKTKKVANKSTKNNQANIKKKTSKAATTKKIESKTSVKKNTTKSLKIPNIVAEYYELPYRYNETIVKILYQTPNILFVYWDISDSDKEQLLKKYNNNFFDITIPFLRIYNITKNYSFDVEINDFANSWYINVQDENCIYSVELIRKYISNEQNQTNIYISSSNKMEFPNNHILLDSLPSTIKFKNIKQNTILEHNFSTFHLIGINKTYSIHKFYKELYKEEIFEDINSRKSIALASSSS